MAARRGSLSVVPQQATQRLARDVLRVAWRHRRRVKRIVAVVFWEDGAGEDQPYAILRAPGCGCGNDDQDCYARECEVAADVLRDAVEAPGAPWRVTPARH